MSGAVQERVVTHEFNLVDDSGQTRVRLGMNELNAPALSLSGQNGQERALLRLNQNDVPSLRLFDGNGILRQGLGFTRGTLTPGLWFFDENGSTQQLIPGADVYGVNRSSASADYIQLSSTQPVYANYTTGSVGQVVNVRAVSNGVYTPVDASQSNNTGSVVIHWNDKTIPGSGATLETDGSVTVVHVK